MRILVKILPPINLTTRLSSNTSNRYLTSLAEVVPEKHGEQNVSCNNSVVEKSFGKKYIFGLIKSLYNTSFDKNKVNLNLPIAFTDLSCNGHSRSCKVLLIPLNWRDVNENQIGNTISSIFLKSKNLQKLDCLTEKILINENTNQTKIPKSKAKTITTIPKDQNPELENSTTEKNQKDTFIVKHQPVNLELSDLLAGALNKRLKKIFSIDSLQLHSVDIGNTKYFNVTINVKPDSLSLSPFMKIYTSNLKQKDISTHKNMKGLLPNSFPLTLTKKHFSTSTTNWSQKDLSAAKIRSKCDPNYNFPHLSKIFGTDNLLMRSDAYNRAIIEAAKRRAALASKKIRNFGISRPQVMNIKGCAIPQLNVQYAIKHELKSMKQARDEKKTIVMPKDCEDPKFEMDKFFSNQKLKDRRNFSESRASILQMKDNFSKNDTSYKLPGYSSTNKSENEKLLLLAKKSEGDGSKSKTDSSGKTKAPKQQNPCLEEDKEYKPKCNEDPCKETKPSGGALKISPGKNIDSGKKKDPIAGIKQKQDPCKRHKKKGVPSKKYTKKENPCKRKGKQKTDSFKKKSPCVSSKPKEEPKMKETQKDDPCKRKEPFGGSKQKEDSSKKKNPCEDNKPKEDPSKKQKEDPCKRKESFGDSKQKEDPCKKEKQKIDSSKKKSPCADSKPKEDASKKEQEEDPCRRKEQFSVSKEKDDPCMKEKQKIDSSKKKSPCADSKSTEDARKKEQQKEDPCKRKEPFGGSKQKQDSPKKKNPCEDSKPKVEQNKNQNEDPCKRKETFGSSKQQKDPCKKETQKEDASKKKNPCEDSKPKEDLSKKEIQKEDTCKRKEPFGGIKQKEDTCKKEQKEDPCKRKEPFGGSKQKEDPCKKEQKDPCKRKEPFGSIKQMEDPCKKEQKEDPCKRKEPFGGSKQKEDPCKKEIQKDPCVKQKEDPYKKEQKEDPCKRKEPFGGSKQKEDPSKTEKQKEDPCKRKEPFGGSKQKQDPCMKENRTQDTSNKQNPCEDSKPKENPHKIEKQINDRCKKNESFDSIKQKEDLFKEQKREPSREKNPCGEMKQNDPGQEKTSFKNEKADPCKTKKINPCESSQKKDSAPTRPQDIRANIKSKVQESSRCGTTKKETKPNCVKNKAATSSQDITTDIKSKVQESSGCGTRKRETKPNCRKDKKYFSTLATSSNSLIKRTLMTLPSLRCKNFFNCGSTRHLSSKRDDKNKKNRDDLARGSQCKAVGSRVPPHRKPAYNPHPKEGLRQCYPTYDMDCKKLCKDARKTDCKKQAFLKNTDNDKRANSNVTTQTDNPIIICFIPLNHCNKIKTWQPSTTIKLGITRQLPIEFKITENGSFRNLQETVARTYKIIPDCLIAITNSDMKLKQHQLQEM